MQSTEEKKYRVWGYPTVSLFLESRFALVRPTLEYLPFEESPREHLAASFPVESSYVLKTIITETPADLELMLGSHDRVYLPEEHCKVSLSDQLVFMGWKLPATLTDLNLLQFWTDHLSWHPTRAGFIAVSDPKTFTALSQIFMDMLFDIQELKGWDFLEPNSELDAFLLCLLASNHLNSTQFAAITLLQSVRSKSLTLKYLNHAINTHISNLVVEEASRIIQDSKVPKEYFIIKDNLWA